MAGHDEHSRGGVSGALRPGALSALLQEIAAAPASTGERWDAGLRPGAVVGRFELIRELGRGGFGVVWEARDRELGRRVAFKAVRAGVRRDLREERLLREAEAAAQLSHPNIVTLHDVGQDEHGPYLVLELLDGRTLADRLSQGALPVPEALRIAVEVAKGLAHAHSHGVVHRDLKPENVFLCQDGQVKVLDFGLAHAFGQRLAGGGTSGYMAPEQVEGAPEDERTDVFAFGVILFQMLAAKLPFPDAKALRTSGKAPVLEVQGALALGQFVGRTLAKKPVERPRDGGELLEALSSLEREVEGAPAAGLPVVRTRSWPRLRLAALVAAGIVIGAAVAAVSLRETGPIAPAPSIAVLPFADMSPGKDQEYFADGVAEEILNALSHVRGVKVVGRTSSFSFKGKKDDLRTIGRVLDTATVLEGSVRKDGGRIRVTAQLVKAEDGFRIWSDSYDRELTGIFAVQDEIAQAVVAALRVKLLPGGAPTTREVRTGNPEVYRLYLLGRDLAKRGTLDEWKRALAAHEQALALDPGYAPAWAGAAFALRYIEGLGGEGTSPAQRKRALDAAERAIALAPDLPDGYWVRAMIRMGFAYDWRGADADLKRARVLSPSDAEVATMSGQLLLTIGRFPEAIDLLRKATVLDPLSALAWERLGIAYTFSNDLERGREALQRSLDVVPGGPLSTLFLVMNLLPAGRPADALAAARRCALDWIRNTGEALAQGDLGHPGEARAALERLIARNADDSAYQIAEVYAWHGEPDRAFEWLERAYAQRDPGLQYTRNDHLLRPLHGDPRWKPFLRRLNLADE